MKRALESFRRSQRELRWLRAQADLAEAIEDLDPPRPPLWIAHLLLIPGLCLFGIAVGAHVALAAL